MSLKSIIADCRRDRCVPVFTAESFSSLADGLSDHTVTHNFPKNLGLNRIPFGYLVTAAASKGLSQYAKLRARQKGAETVLMNVTRERVELIYRLPCENGDEAKVGDWYC